MATTKKRKPGPTGYRPRTTAVQEALGPSELPAPPIQDIADLLARIGGPPAIPPMTRLPPAAQVRFSGPPSEAPGPVGQPAGSLAGLEPFFGGRGRQQARQVPLGMTTPRPGFGGYAPMGAAGAARPMPSAFSPPANIPQEMAYVSPWREYMTRERNAPQAPSAEAEAIAAQIMGQERARFEAEARAPIITRSSKGLLGQSLRARAPYGGYGTELAGQAPALMTPTRLPPRAAEPTAETAQERAARIEEAIRTGRGLATNRQAGPGETTALAEYLRGVTQAQAGWGEMPAPFQGEPIDEGARMQQAMARPEPISPAQRKARRQSEMDIRSIMREGRRTGQPMTRGQAEMLSMIQGKVKAKEELQPQEMLALYGPEAAQYSPTMIRAAMSQGLPQAIAALARNPETAKEAAQLSRQYQEMIAGVAPRKETTAPSAPSPTTLDDVVRAREIVAQSLPKLVDQFDEALGAGDEEEVARLARLAGATPELASHAAGIIRSLRGPTFGEEMGRTIRSPWSPTGLTAHLANLIRGAVMPGPSLPEVPQATLERLRERAKTDPQARRVLGQIEAAERRAAPQRRWWK